MSASRRLIAFTTAAALSAGVTIGLGATAQAAPVQVAPITASDHGPGIAASDTARQRALESALEEIASIPQGVIDGGEASVQAYAFQKRMELLRGSASNGQRTDGALACTGAILVAVGSLAIPYAKILKLRKFIRKTGSAREAAYLLIRIADGEAQLAEVGPVLLSLGAEILGIDAIRKNC